MITTCSIATALSYFACKILNAVGFAIGHFLWEIDIGRP